MRRTDIFAFGVVLYKMLSGRRPFEGKSQASVIGAILELDPAPVTSLQPQTPPLLGELVARCLAKDPDGRWQSARDLKWQLEWIAAGNWAGAVTSSRAEPRHMRGRLLRMSAALLTGAAIAGGTFTWLQVMPSPSPPVISRFTFVLPEGQQFTRGGRRVVAVSPDGTRLVYAANQQLYLRNMHELAASLSQAPRVRIPASPSFHPMDSGWRSFQRAR